MEQEIQAIARQVAHGTLRSYIMGFLISLVLTLGAYFIVANKLIENSYVNGALILLAFIQMVIQFLFFLHLGSESKPRWNQVSFLFMLTVIIIIVGGTFWIMESLNERTMPSMDHTMDLKAYLHYQE